MSSQEPPRICWRGQPVRLVRLAPDGRRAQIARPGLGLRWVPLGQLELPPAQEPRP